MADHPRFGPAGIPLAFDVLKRSVEDVPEYLHNEGLDAFEYQAVRWGPKPQMQRENAEKLGTKAKKHDVRLSLHGSYFVNFCGDALTVEASKRRLISCITAADWMGAHEVVFHPGFYSKSREGDLQRCVKAMNEIVESMKSSEIANVYLAPETSGKIFQVGSLDETLTLCEKVEFTKPTIDWSHLHARENGKLKTIDDFRQVINEIERRLGTSAVKKLHCHYTRVEFSRVGERRHHTIDETKYGPDFEPLAILIAELGLNPVILSESPLLDIDSQKMQDIVFREISKRKQAVDPSSAV